MRGPSLRMKSKGHWGGGGGAQNFEFQYIFFGFQKNE